MLKLSKHFVKNWQRRVGGEPRSAGIRQMICQAVRIQKGLRFITRAGYYKSLTIYWHTGLNIIITVDHFTNTAVSVYSKDMDLKRPIGAVMEWA